MDIDRLGFPLKITPCYEKLVIALISHLSDKELQTCLLNNNTIDAETVIHFFKVIGQTSKFDINKCICGVHIQDVYFVQKISTNITLPIGSICIHKFDKFRNEFEHFDKTVWNVDKYCKHCGKKGLRGWRKGKVHKKCYRDYKISLAKRIIAKH